MLADPFPPTGLTLSAVTNESFRATWTAPQSGRVDFYNVKYKNYNSENETNIRQGTSANMMDLQGDSTYDVTLVSVARSNTQELTSRQKEEKSQLTSKMLECV